MEGRSVLGMPSLWPPLPDHLHHSARQLSGPKGAGTGRKRLISGGAPNSCRFLDFPTGSPYTDPAFKLSVRRPIGPAPRARGFRQVVGASRQFRGPPPPALIPRHSLSEAPGMISGVRSSEDTGMPTGTIARLLIDKGFGFIRDEAGIEHFFHRSSVRGAVFELLREGQRVEFTT